MLYEKFYYMDSLTMGLIKHHHSIYKEIMEWKEHFQLKKKELNMPSFSQILQSGYFAVYTLVDKILTQIIPRYEQLHKMFQKLRELTEKNPHNFIFGNISTRSE